jgi:hypothetical protein
MSLSNLKYYSRSKLIPMHNNKFVDFLLFILLWTWYSDNDDGLNYANAWNIT